MFNDAGFGNHQSYVPYHRPQSFAPQRRPQISGDQLIRVAGFAGAQALASAMDANSRVSAFDANEDLLYIVTTDGAAYPTVQTFNLSPYVQAAPEAAKEPVYRDEFDSFKKELKEAMENVKQLVQGKSGNTAAEKAEQ